MGYFDIPFQVYQYIYIYIYIYINFITFVMSRTQSLSSPRDNGRAFIRRALQVCQALLTNSKKNDIIGLKSPNKHINQ